MRDKRLRPFEIKVWVMEGCRPSHDTPALCSGVEMTEYELNALRNRILKYYETCRLRRHYEKQNPLGA